MREQYQQQGYHPLKEDRIRNLKWAGGFLLAVGALHVVQGLVALLNGEYFTKRTEYLFRFNMTTWGWVHLVLGLVAIATGIALFRRMPWAKPVTITMAAVSILVSFAWLPFQVIGSVLLMVADCVVIGAVVAPGVFDRDD